MALTEKRDMFGAMVTNVRKDGSHNGWPGSFEMGAVAWSGRLSLIAKPVSFFRICREPHQN